jgi:hypothetical protein
MVPHLYTLIHLTQYMTRTGPVEKGRKGLTKQLLIQRMKIQMKLEMWKWKRIGCLPIHPLSLWLH